MTDEEELSLFRLSEAEPSDIFTIYIVVLHRLEDRASQRDLELILTRLALKPSERLTIVLEITTLCPKAIAKAALRLCRHCTVSRGSIDRPLVAAAEALADVALRSFDVVTVLKGVMPAMGADFVDRLVDRASVGDVEFLTLAPASHCAFAATVRLLSEFSTDLPGFARHQDADLLLACWSGRDDVARGLQHLLGDDKKTYLLSTLSHTVAPPVTADDVDVLDRVALRLGLHISEQGKPALQQAAAQARFRLRRACAAHFRDDTDQDEVVSNVLYAKNTGIVLYATKLAPRAAPCVIPAVLCELGVRQFSEQLGCVTDGDAAYRKALLNEFVEVKERLADVARRVVSTIARNPLLHCDNARRGGGEERG